MRFQREATVTHSSHGQAGAGPNEHPHSPHPQHARRSRTKLASALLGVVLAVLAVVAGGAIYQMRETNLQLSEANQVAASSTIQTLQSRQVNPPGESVDSTLIETMLPHRYSNRYRRFAPISRAAYLHSIHTGADC